MNCSEKIVLPQEYSVCLRINGQQEVQLICTNEALEELTIGFLYNAGLISTRADIGSLEIQNDGALVQVQLNRDLPVPCVSVRASGLGGMLLGNGPSLQYRAIGRVYSLLDLQKCVAVAESCAVKYRQTGGIHCTALFEGTRLLAAYEDVGRHNTLDKIAGYCLQNGITPSDSLMITSGRISSEMVSKAARIGASVVASYTTPTQKAYDLASAANLTLVGYVKGERMRVYCGTERIG